MGEPALAPEFERYVAADRALAAAALYRATHRREFAPRWYPWQRRFLDGSATHNAIFLLAGNRVGKTLTGSYATACDITGRYRDDWGGARIPYHVNAWVLGVDGKQTRDVMQRELLGIEGADGVWRGGWIHHDEIDTQSVERSHLPGAIDGISIRHASGGESRLSFKSYTQSSTGQSTLPMAGSSVDVMQIDEQPPDGVVGQLVTRTMTGRRGLGGIMRFTMTPELGLTDLVNQVMNNPAPHQLLVGPIAWAECAHLSPAIQEQMLASYPQHERDMRSKGVPLFGTGKVFTFDESQVVIPPIDLTTVPWWKCIRALDVGIDHPTAIAWLALDPESGTVHLCRTHRASDLGAAIHASVANSQWPGVPMVVPHDIDNREPGSGKEVRDYYEAAGVKPCIDFANPTGGNHVEPGIFAMQEALLTGKFKVWKGLADHFVEECRSYHRDERGKVVKVRDDVISAVRYGFQMIGLHGTQASTRSGHAQSGLYRDLGLSVRSRGDGRWQQQNRTYGQR